MKKNIDIEALRAYAVLITIVAHLGELIPGWTKPLSVFWLGGGVDLFFCISGFLICGILLDQLGDNFKVVAKKFWIKRAFRLMPASIFWGGFSLACAFYFNDAIFGPVQYSVINAIYSLFFSENAYIVGCFYYQLTECAPSANYWIYWSLSLEEQFYMLFPFLLFFIRLRYLLIVLAAVATYQLFSVRPWGTPLWFFRTDAIILGVLLAVVRRSIRFEEIRLFAKSESVRLITVFLLFMGLWWVARRDWFPLFHSYVVLVAFALVLIASFNKNYIVKSSLGQRLASYLGARSYSMYLVHVIAFFLTRELFASIGVTGELSGQLTILMLIVAAAVLALLVEFSYRLIERPCRLFGRKLAVIS
jgi:peptidoglycan/LPS O-acetylase OafA/YrhL